MAARAEDALIPAPLLASQPPHKNRTISITIHQAHPPPQEPCEAALRCST